MSPTNAADQIAKALEQTEKAQQEAGKAQQQLGDKPMGEPMKNPAADLQKLQEQVAEKAGDLKKDDAEKAAAEAAEALKMGDIPAPSRPSRRPSTPSSRGLATSRRRATSRCRREGHG